MNQPQLSRREVISLIPLVACSSIEGTLPMIPVDQHETKSERLLSLVNEWVKSVSASTPSRSAEETEQQIISQIHTLVGDDPGVIISPLFSSLALRADSTIEFSDLHDIWEEVVTHRPLHSAG